MTKTDRPRDAESQSVLRARARQAIETGKLPRRRPDRTWGGPGAGAYCTICGAPVKGDEVELEIEFALQDDGSGIDKHHVHFHCFAAWETELRKYPQDAARVLPGRDKKRNMGGRGNVPQRRGSV